MLRFALPNDAYGDGSVVQPRRVRAVLADFKGAFFWKAKLRPQRDFNLAVVPLLRSTSGPGPVPHLPAFVSPLADVPSTTGRKPRLWPLGLRRQIFAIW